MLQTRVAPLLQNSPLVSVPPAKSFTPCRIIYSTLYKLSYIKRHLMHQMMDETFTSREDIEKYALHVFMSENLRTRETTWKISKEMGG